MSEEILHMKFLWQNIHLINQERELNSLLTSWEEATEGLNDSHKIFKADTNILTNIAKASVTIVVKLDIGSSNVHSYQ